MELFTEDVWPLIWLLACAVLGLAIALFATGRAKYLFWMSVPILLAILLFVVESLIVTPRERIDRTLWHMAVAAENEDMDELIKHLTADCQFGRIRGAEALRQYGSRVFKMYQVDRVSLGTRKIQVNGDRGEAEFHATANAAQGTFIAKWRLGFERDDAGNWRANSIEYTRALSENEAPSDVPRLPAP